MSSLEQELCFSHPLSPGSLFCLPKGQIVCSKSMDFLRSEYRKRGFEEVISPMLYKMELWEKAAHTDKLVRIKTQQNEEYGVKTENCPGHCLMFNNGIRSYRELPLRMVEFDIFHSASAASVDRKGQDHAHIFCSKSDVPDELVKTLEFIDLVYKAFKIDYCILVSKRPENFTGDVDLWLQAEAQLIEVLNASARKWEFSEDSSVSCGPKISFVMQNTAGTRRCASVELDFQLPERFHLNYVTLKEGVFDKPVLIHLTILEDLLSILFQPYGGKWPFWLSPRQVILLSENGGCEAYGKEVEEKLQRAGLEVDSDFSSKSMDEKVEEGERLSYNYIVIVSQDSESENSK